MPRLDHILITVNTLIGTSFSIVAEPTDSVYKLKERISLQEGVDRTSQHILFDSKELKDDESLEDVGLSHGSTVTLVLSMKVGPLKTKSIQLDIDAFENEIEFDFDEEEDDVQLLLVKVNGSLYLYPAPKCNKFNYENFQSRPIPKWNRERYYENAVTREKVNSLRRKMDIKKRMRTKTEISSRLPSARPRTVRKTPRKVFRSHTYENARNAINLLKAEIYLQTKRNKMPGKAPYTFSQLGQYVRAKISIILEEERTAAGESLDYIPRAKSIVPTVLTRSMLSARCSTTATASETSSSSTLSFRLDNHTITTAKSRGQNNESGMLESQNQPIPPISAKGRRSEAWITTPNKAITNGKSKTHTRISTARPPVSKKPKASTSNNNVKRCAQCRKKLSVVNEYECRCGQFFCSTHRYAETHKCTFDYKEEGWKLNTLRCKSAIGRRIIKEANPVVTAPKVPQI